MPKSFFPVKTPFWERVTKMESGCWEWQGARGKTGYGIYGPKGKGMCQAYRYAYEQTYGPIPKGMHVLHRCDNPPCVRPDHLFLGTNADNIADKMRKGRWGGGSLPGVQNPAAKLTADQVREIRIRGDNGETKVALSRIYGVSDTIIGNIVRRKSYRDVE